MRRRTVLTALVGLCTVTVGCTGGCSGVALAIELTPPESDRTGEVVNFDELDLSAEGRDILIQATEERVVGCTRDDIPALERLGEVVVEHAGVSEHDLYYSQGTASAPARFRGEPYRAVIIYDTAETGGGPLGV